MTLSPVFRSTEAVALLRSEGVWDRLAGAVAGQAEAVRRVRVDLGHVVDADFVRRGPDVPGPSEASLDVLQEFFFLILFRSVLESLGVEQARLDFYSEVDFCIQGTIMAADDLFDDQSRSLLPLETGSGPRYGSVLHLLCFSRLLERVFDRGVEAGVLTGPERDATQRELLSRMAEIGTLEGAEEGGAGEILEPERMIEAVHRLRGGRLFELGFVAPRRLEQAAVGARVIEATEAIGRLGTAFQIVDDLTDFETDARRGSNNLLISQIHHRGSRRERDALRVGMTPTDSGDRLVEDRFLESARVVLDLGRAEAHAGLEGLHRLGFWMDPGLADPLVRAIVGLDGLARMRAVAGRP